MSTYPICVRNFLSTTGHERLVWVLRDAWMLTDHRIIKSQHGLD